MTILGIMQNQWLKNAGLHQRRLDQIKAKQGEEMYVKTRRRMIHYALFAGCRSGQVLKSYLGDELCEQIIWDEASKVIGTHPNDCPPADLEHIKWTLDNVKPDLVITFGRIAGDALFNLPGIEDGVTFKWIPAPHPACRHPDDHARLKEACARIKELAKSGLTVKP